VLLTAPVLQARRQVQPVSDLDLVRGDA
jgi:hypothetical protein